MQTAAAATDQQQQQQWLAVQYGPLPPPSLLMPHQMVAPPPPPLPQYADPQRFVPFRSTPPLPQPPAFHRHHHQHHKQQKQSNNNNNGGQNGDVENKTIWAGDLHYWMDESYLHSCFAQTCEVSSIKVIRNKHTGLSEGYGFVEFYTHAAAEKVLQNFNGQMMPNVDQPFRLNWASFSMGEKRSDLASDHSIFVGDLAADVTDSMLQETFASKYPSVKGAKVVMDVNTGRSKGYGFVRFGDDNEKNQAMNEMNGVLCSTRPMRIGAATPRKSGGFGSNATSTQSDGESTNTTVFVGGLDPNVSEDELRQAFSQYGEIASVKIPLGKQCGFVQFVNRNNAEKALQQLNGKIIGKQTVRLSWGRSPASKQVRTDYGSPWNGMYYGGHFYDGYGYAAPFQGPPGMYATAYGAYPMYMNQQQVT